MSVDSRWMPCNVKIEPNVQSTDCDGIILVSSYWPPGFNEPEPFKTVLYAAAKIDSALGKVCTPVVLPINLPARRFIYSPTGVLNADYHDLRSFGEAATRGIQRAVEAGVRYPMIVILPDARFENVELVTLLGALEGLYVPLEEREISGDYCNKAYQLGVWSPISSKNLEGIVKLACALESGRYVARDIGGADPERMTPHRVEEYIAELFNETRILMQVVSDEETLLHEYPLFATVNRAASVIPRHRGRIIFLTYEPMEADGIAETLMIVAKGLTYDTGGTVTKDRIGLTGGSRHKCGVAAAAGFMQVVNLLKPPTTKVVVALCVLRNSTGENGYVPDEVITGKSGRRVRIVNTDIEGRLSIADALFHIKEMAMYSVNPHIFTIATVMTQAKLATGTGYSLVIDNAVARSVNNAEKLEISGDLIGDPFETVRLRREDFLSFSSSGGSEDIERGSVVPITRRERFQQSPAAFLIMTSALDKHGIESEFPLKYTFIGLTSHLSVDRDLAKPYQGNPVLGMSYCYLIQGKCLTIRRDLQPPAMQYVSELESTPVPIATFHSTGITADSPQNPPIVLYHQPVIPYPQPLSDDPCTDSDKCEFPKPDLQAVKIQDNNNSKRNGLSTA
ncbi:putative aminopeptidase W07G4.4 [Microplitis mediator]|uniref:putative aminopeptidase W07G4.4 n=1 Tax=Microplitis mediator TaxID=375433 RepID=UPI002552FBC4|nr:putative aminopeptidase W07G4.4 [Microplitis mediator]